MRFYKPGINEKTIEKLLNVIDFGLSHGLGIPKPGHMCVQGAISNVMGYHFNDRPECVADNVREWGISLNDSIAWGSAKERAKGLRRYAVAELGSNTLDLNKIQKRVFKALGALIDRPEASIHGVMIKKGNSAATGILIADTIAMVLSDMGSPGAKFLHLTCPKEKRK